MMPTSYFTDIVPGVFFFPAGLTVSVVIPGNSA
jgi:hypothetical protein